MQLKSGEDMAWSRIAAALAFAALSVSSPAVSIPIDPSPDSAEQRESLRRLTVCLAEARPRWARQTLAYPYLSDAQRYSASAALVGRDSCATGPETEFTFRTSSLVGSLAEHFVESDLRGVDFRRVAQAINRVAPRNASEDFALCVAARNPVAVRDLVVSEPGSANERRAAEQLARHLPDCFQPDERQEVDLQALRALMATALYRGVRSALAGGN